MTEPNADLLADPTVPTIELDGKRWPIPRLSLEQISEILPLIERRSARIKAAQVAGETPPIGELFPDMATVVFLGLRRGHDKLSRAEFDKMGMDMDALRFAFELVCNQTKAYKPAAPRDPRLGPDLAETLPGGAPGSSQTGTP